MDPQLLAVRLNHLSDGRGQFFSRSFNRLGAGLLFDRRGYGDGLIDYDRLSNRISVGAMFVRWH